MKFSLQECMRITSHVYPSLAQFAVEISPACRELDGGQALFTEAAGPVGDQHCMSGTRHRVLIDARLGIETAGDEVDILAWGRDHDAAAGSSRKASEIRVQHFYFLLAFEHDEVIIRAFCDGTRRQM